MDNPHKPKLTNQRFESSIILQIGHYHRLTSCIALFEECDEWSRCFGVDYDSRDAYMGNIFVQEVHERHPAIGTMPPNHIDYTRHKH